MSQKTNINLEDFKNCLKATQLKNKIKQLVKHNANTEILRKKL